MNLNTKMTHRLLALASAGALVLAAGCDAAAAPAQASAETGPKAIEVQTTTAGYGTIDRQTEFVGKVEAAESTKVYPASAGKVLKVYAAAGERVEKGTLLFELDTEDLQTAVETARLQYEAALSGADTSIINAKQAYDSYGDAYITAKEYADQAEDAYNAAKTAYNAANNAVEEAQAAYDSDNSEENLKALQEAKVELATAKLNLTNASKAQEDMEDSLNSTRKKMITARDTYKNTKGDEEEGVTGTVQTQVDLAKISYDKAVENLEKAKVYAPVAGIVSQKTVAASDMASPQNPAFVIDQEGGAPVVSFNLSEDGANALTVGSRVTVIYSGEEYPAEVTEISNTANPQTGLYAAKAKTDEPLGTTRSGGVVKVRASTAKAENTLMLPLDLLEYEGNQPYIYVYRDGAAVRVDVTTGISSADEVVILEGLTQEDQVITTWHPDLKDGAAVTLGDQQEKGE